MRQAVPPMTFLRRLCREALRTFQRHVPADGRFTPGALISGRVLYSFSAGINGRQKRHRGKRMLENRPTSLEKSWHERFSLEELVAHYACPLPSDSKTALNYRVLPLWHSGISAFLMIGSAAFLPAASVAGVLFFRERKSFEIRARLVQQ